MGALIDGLLGFEMEIDRAIEAARKMKRRTDDAPYDAGGDSGGRGGGGSTRPTGWPINLSGDPLFGFIIDPGGAADYEGAPKSPSDCKRTGNDLFSQRLYLQCRCKRGDRGACQALAKLEGKR